jgi:hypothetical protein
LLCSSTSIPFNMVVALLKWDFFRDPQSIVDAQNPLEQNQMLISSLPERP